MFDMYLNIEQEKREKQEIDRIHNEASVETDRFNAGDFDGGIGIDPDPNMWKELSYRSGFLTGITRHYDQKYQVKLDEPF